MANAFKLAKKAPRLLMPQAKVAAIEARAWKLVRASKDNPTCCKEAKPSIGRTGSMEAGGRNLVVIFGHKLKKQPPRVSFFCPKCKKNADRDMTPAEVSLFRQVDAANDVQGTAMHHLCHTFLRIFQDKEGKWRWSGWEMMKRLDKLLPTKLKGIVRLGCDDSFHANSEILLIPHATYWKGKLDYYWGTTVVYIAQCSGDQPISFFFYRSHAKHLRDALSNIVKMHKSHGDRW